MIYSGSEKHPPFISLLLLLGLVLAGALLFSIIGIALAGSIYGFSPILNSDTTDPGYMDGLKVIQILTSIGMFVLPAILFARMQTSEWKEYLKLYRFSAMMIPLAIFIMLGFAPFIEWSGAINKSMQLPDFLQGLEDWMLRQEEQMEVLTKQLLIMKGYDTLALNLFMFAVIPAIGEELLFRGCLQRIFIKWTNNYHIGIWVAAIIFSTIHFQFYGFLPRMLLGALFGYLMVWSGSIWPAIAGHFINNAAAVITAYVYQMRGESLDKLDNPDPISWYFYVGGAVLGGIALWYFKRTLEENMVLSETDNGSRLD